MFWIIITRVHYDRMPLRYASDSTDAEWLLIEPFMPAPNLVGRPRKWSMRTIYGMRSNISQRQAVSGEWCLKIFCFIANFSCLQICAMNFGDLLRGEVTGMVDF